MKHVYAMGRHPEAAITAEAWRRGLASTLRRTGAGMLRLAERLARVQARRRRAPELEFYAEAGAPEGALYVDGQLIGTLPGVTRL
ncbi:hypothetical protein G8A07_24600 [Roseateles sp. DAIF2]|uniref:hypothetical protein n=1 Tax=Roseateles sp. DAIF2 TaxID=2714952 RepID=UPI0018A29350|nr:hypothetical protein [Roseateles sp. DAIF2]QPF71459.1 hypothetical protein G8A07_24600 [Roseateles sp. DAIF2]